MVPLTLFEIQPPNVQGYATKHVHAFINTNFLQGSISLEELMHGTMRIIDGTMNSVGGTMITIGGTMIAIGGTKRSVYGPMKIVGRTTSTISGNMSIFY